MDVLLRVDVALLVLMLAYTFVLILGVARCYRIAQGTGANSLAWNGLIATLEAHARSLKAIASIAPYLGLLGTCLGILGLFGAVAIERRAYLTWVTLRMAAALVSSATGIIVAISATFGNAYARNRLESILNTLPSRNLLTRPFAQFPPYAVIMAWLLAILIRVFFLNFAELPSPKGFQVEIASLPCGPTDHCVVLRITKQGGIFLNLEEQGDSQSLQNRLSRIYRLQEHGVLYLSADEGVPFQTVADAIDIVKSNPNIAVQLLMPTTTGCPALPSASTFTAHPSNSRPKAPVASPRKLDSTLRF